MKARRIYRKYNDPAFPLHTMCYHTQRIMPSFTNIHWHPEPELLYVKEGEYEILYESKNITLQAGEVCIVPTGKVHAIRALTQQGQYWSISFSMDLITMTSSHYFQQQLVNPLRSGTLVVPKKLTLAMSETPKAIAALEAVLTGSKDEKFLGIISFWLAVLPLCTIGATNQESAHGHSAVEACIRYMHTNYASKITLEELAEYVHLHPNYLCGLFKSHAGVTIFEYLSQVRLREAQRLFRQESHSVSQVAEMCGFNDIDHFAKKFKANTGATPTAFRKAYSEK